MNATLPVYWNEWTGFTHLRSFWIKISKANGRDKSKTLKLFYWLQGHITELQQEITEMKAINRLDPDELKEKIQDVLAYRDSQRDRNSELEEQIKSLRNRLNEIKCGNELPGGEAESTEETKSGAAKENETDDGMNLNEEIIDGIMVNTHDETDIVIGHSRSADVVSGNEIKPPRETKSDQNQSPIENENAPVHVRPLLHQRKSLAERLRLLMMTSDQAECPPGDSEDIVNPRQLLPLLLPSKQHPDEVMPIQGPRHPTWPRPSYANGQLPGCYIPLPPLHPRMDDGFPMVVNHLPHPSTSPRPPDRDSPTPAIQTPLPPICPRPPDGNSVTANQFPHPPLSPRSLANGRPKTAKARHVSLLSTCLASYDRKSPKPSVAFFISLNKDNDNRESPSCSSIAESDSSVSSSQNPQSSARSSPAKDSSTPINQTDSTPSYSCPDVTETPLPANHTQHPPSSPRPEVSDSPTTTNQIPHPPTNPPPDETENTPWWRFKKKKRERKPPSPQLQPANVVVTVDGVSLKFLWGIYLINAYLFIYLFICTYVYVSFVYNVPNIKSFIK